MCNWCYSIGLLTFGGGFGFVALLGWCFCASLFWGSMLSSLNDYFNTRFRKKIQIIIGFITIIARIT